MRRIRVSRVILAIFILFLISRMDDGRSADVPKAREGHSPARPSYQKNKSKELVELTRLLFGLPSPQALYNADLVARAELLCANDVFGLSTINARIVNPETAIEICLQDNEYWCAYEIAKKYRGYLPDEEKYDPVWLLKQFRDAADDTMSWRTVAEEFEELGLPAEAEKIYEEIYPDLGPSVLLEFYARENRDEDAINFINETGVSISGVAYIGKLQEWGFYDEYLSACQKQPEYWCLQKLEHEAITPELLERAWVDLDEFTKEFGKEYSFKLFERAGIANLAWGAEIDADYYVFVRVEIMKQIQAGKSIDTVLIEDAVLYDDLLKAMEQYGVDPRDLARFAEFNEDYDKAYEWYRQSDAGWVFEGAETAAVKGDSIEAEELYALYLEKMAGEDKTLNDLGKIAYAQHILHNWDEAIWTCETQVSNWGRCDCAAEVIEHLYFHINGDIWPEWKLYYEE